MSSSAMHSGRAFNGLEHGRIAQCPPRNNTPRGRAQKKPASGAIGPVAGIKNKSGDTYFRTCSTIIGSESLTTEFGMDRV